VSDLVYGKRGIRNVSSAGIQPYQNMNLAATCAWRGLLYCVLTTPNVAFPKATPGNPNLTWFATLKNPPAKLQVEAAVLTEMVILEDAKVEIILAVAAHAGHRASGGAVGVRRRLKKHTRIEPLIEPRARSAGLRR